MSVNLHITPGDDIPIYRQLVRQVEAAVIAGRLYPGERLPSQRELAQELVIAPLTVKRAYDELEAFGFLRMERGRGTFACAPPIVSSDIADAELKSAIRKILELAWQHKISFHRLRVMLKEEKQKYRMELKLSGNPEMELGTRSSHRNQS